MEKWSRLFPPCVREQSAPLRPLTEEQQRFAAENHDLIYAFLHRGRLPVSEYYDVAALGFLRAVQRYLTLPALKKYAFPTIAWQSMGREITVDWRTEERRRKAERRYMETSQLSGSCAKLETTQAFHDLMSGASEEQRRIALLRLQGCTMKEISQTLGMDAKRVRRLLNEFHDNVKQERGIHFNEYRGKTEQNTERYAFKAAGCGEQSSYPPPGQGHHHIPSSGHFRPYGE